MPPSALREQRLGVQSDHLILPAPCSRHQYRYECESCSKAGRQCNPRRITAGIGRERHGDRDCRVRSLTSGCWEQTIFLKVRLGFCEFGDRLGLIIERR